eukprot:gene6404-7428_t
MEEVHGKLVEVASFINEYQRTAEDNNRLMQLQNLIEGNVSILEPTRRILREISVKVKEVGIPDDYHARAAFIFNDCLIFAKTSSFHKKYQFSFSLPFHSTKVVQPSTSRTIRLSGNNGDNEAICIEILFENDGERTQILSLLETLLPENKVHVDRHVHQNAVFLALVSIAESENRSCESTDSRDILWSRTCHDIRSYTMTTCRSTTSSISLSE